MSLLASFARVLVALVAIAVVIPAAAAQASLPVFFGVEAPPTLELRAEARRLFESEQWFVELRPSWRLVERRFEPLEVHSFSTEARGFGVELIRRGLARGHFACDDSELRPGEVEAAVAAAREAQAMGAGLFEDLPKPGPMVFPVAGVALPMHYKKTDGNYEWELREIKALGAEWVNLLVVTRQASVDAEWVPVSSERTPTDARIKQTIGLARRFGLRVQLMPIVLLREAGPKDWRGTITPSDPAQWWRSYDRYICHMADLAAIAGAEAFSVGSEFASLETHESSWRRVIANVRLRYSGHLTYSANWDHFAGVPFWDALDFASMTAYFTLCPEDADKEADKEVDGAPNVEPPAKSQPTVPFDLDDCVRAGWQAGLDELVRLALISKLPAVFSEVGVPSVTGALAGPWNYTLDEAPDPAAQALAFRLFRDVFLPGGTPAAYFHGGFLYDYWGLGGLEGKSYTPRGKPAAMEWREILRGLRGD